MPEQLAEQRQTAEGGHPARNRADREGRRREDHHPASRVAERRADRVEDRETARRPGPGDPGDQGGERSGRDQQRQHGMAVS